MPVMLTYLDTFYICLHCKNEEHHWMDCI